MEHYGEPTSVLRQLHAGDLSRNRDYDFFSRPAGKRLHILYRRLASLLAELAEPDCVARWQPLPSGEDQHLLLQISRMSYRRTTRLSGWEARFLLHDMGASRHLHVLPSGDNPWA